MIDFGRIIKSPLKDERWAAKVAIGGLFPLIPALSFLSMVTMAALAARFSGQWLAGALLGFVVTISTAVFVLSPLLNFFSLGYIVTQARKVYSKGGDRLPEWRNWKKLFVDGVMYFLIYFVYKLIPILMVIWGVVFPMGGPGGAVVRYMTAILAFVLGLGAAFLIPMAICNFVARGRLAAAFDFNSIIEKIKISGKDYVPAYAVSLGVFLGIYIFSLLLGVVIIGWIMFPFLMFYASIAFARMFMEIYPPDESEYLNEVEAEIVQE